MKKIHPVLHNALLEKTSRIAKKATNIQLEAEEEEDEYEAENILDFKRVNGKLEAKELVVIIYTKS